MKLFSVRLSVLVALAFSLSVVGGCGKVAKVGKEVVESFSKKIDETPTNQTYDSSAAPTLLKAEPTGDLELFYKYLAIKVPINAIRQIQAKTAATEPFRLIPHKAQLKGFVTMQGAALPIEASYSISKSCAWTLNVSFTFFFENDENLIRADMLRTEDESLDAMTSTFTQYDETALVDSVNASDGQLLDQTLSKGLIRKIEGGFEVEFSKPDQTTLMQETEILFSAESEQFVLNKIAAGSRSFTYNLFDEDAAQLFTREEVRASRTLENPAGFDLWQIVTQSHTISESGVEDTISSTEVINQNGIPLFMQIDLDGGDELELWLKDISLTEPILCIENSAAPELEQDMRREKIKS
jgi:hypothetical protein